MNLPTVGVTRYVTPLREGGSMPGIVEAEDLGTYVCKFRGAGQGVRVLVAEVIVGELARRIGLNTPRLVGLDLDLEIARYEADEEVQDLLTPARASTSAWTSCRARSASTVSCTTGPGSPRQVLWLDAFCANVDRTLAQPQPPAVGRRAVGDRPRRLAVLPPRLVAAG